MAHGYIRIIIEWEHNAHPHPIHFFMLTESFNCIFFTNLFKYIKGDVCHEQWFKFPLIVRILALIIQSRTGWLGVKHQITDILVKNQETKQAVTAALNFKVVLWV